MWWKKWKYIGYWMPVIENNPDRHAIYKLYLRDDGKRTWKRIAPRRFTSNMWMRQGMYAAKTQLTVWKIGGPFPRGFQAEEDTLVKMLDTMINKKLGV